MHTWPDTAQACRISHMCEFLVDAFATFAEIYTACVARDNPLNFSASAIEAWWTVRVVVY